MGMNRLSQCLKHDKIKWAIDISERGYSFLGEKAFKVSPTLGKASSDYRASECDASMGLG
jgi:hypothetical protein